MALKPSSLVAVAGLGLAVAAGLGTARGQVSICTSRVQEIAQDFGQLQVFRAANAALGAPTPDPPRIVFMGDSITAFWIDKMPGFFAGRPYIDRGIGGQTTPQILVRFRQDVVGLKPKVVVILAGINDLHGATGPATPAMVEDNLASMVEIARANGIRPVLASLLPNAPVRAAVAEVNRWMRAYAEAHHLVYLDYHTPLADAQDALPTKVSGDGLHPNAEGYRIMAPLADAAIAQALRS